MPTLVEGEWPVGLSLTGQWGSEPLLIYVGKALETAFREASDGGNRGSGDSPKVDDDGTLASLNYRSVL